MNRILQIAKYLMMAVSVRIFVLKINAAIIRKKNQYVSHFFKTSYQSGLFSFYLPDCVKQTGFILFTFLILTSCTGEQLNDCYTKTGPEITEERQVGVFHRIELYNNVNLVLVPGNTPYVEIRGGKNLLSAIKTEVIDSTLVIINTLKCNWVRSFDREITVYATTPALREIRYEGSGDISTQGLLTYDSLQVSIWGGAGSFTLNLEVTKLNLAMHYGTVDLHVKGKSLITTIFANSYGPFYCNDLISNIVYIRNSGTNNCYVHAVHVIEAEITSVGDIYYSGDPYNVKSDITGSGKLVKVSQ